MQLYGVIAFINFSLCFYDLSICVSHAFEDLKLVALRRNGYIKLVSIICFLNNVENLKIPAYDLTQALKKEYDTIKTLLQNALNTLNEWLPEKSGFNARKCEICGKILNLENLPNDVDSSKCRVLVSVVGEIAVDWIRNVRDDSSPEFIHDWYSKILHSILASQGIDFTLETQNKINEAVKNFINRYNDAMVFNLPGENFYY